MRDFNTFDEDTLKEFTVFSKHNINGKVLLFAFDKAVCDYVIIAKTFDKEYTVIYTNQVYAEAYNWLVEMITTLSLM